MTGVPPEAVIIGGGLAGSEAAWTLAERGHRVTIHEMRPGRPTPAHQTGTLAELVCSNSFKSVDITNAHGLLKAELGQVGSLIMAVAADTSIPGGTALVVDREAFATEVDRRVRTHPKITVVEEEVETLPEVGIVATGPLTTDRLAQALTDRLGADALAFYDAIAPIVADDSLDRSQLFLASRYGKGAGDDYLNVPLTESAYTELIAGLTAADPYQGHDFDEVPYFEGCLPVEEMARRGPETLRFGPLKPVGLPDPRTGQIAHAVIQLRREDQAGQMWNLVGFQTRLRIPDQQRILRALPGMAHVEFLRFGSIHRNSYVNSPACLAEGLRVGESGLFLAGQITGVEGYTESVATGWLAGLNLSRHLQGRPPVVPPPTTMLGGLCRYLRDADPKHFQPMNANFGLVDPLAGVGRIRKAEKRSRLAKRGLDETAAWWATAQ